VLAGSDIRRDYKEGDRVLVVTLPTSGNRRDYEEGGKDGFFWYERRLQLLA
jgi:hypothetical protein